MKRLVMSVLFVTGILGLIQGQQSSQSKDAGWEKIGQTTINPSDDYGIFDWNKDRQKTVNANEKYTLLKFRTNAKVNLTNVQVQYGDGEKANLQFERPVAPDTEQQFRLDAGKEIDKVTFSYFKDESAPSEKAVVEIWGKKADSPGMGQGTEGSKDKSNIDVDVEVDTVKVSR